MKNDLRPWHEAMGKRHEVARVVEMDDVRVELRQPPQPGGSVSASIERHALQLPVRKVETAEHARGVLIHRVPLAISADAHPEVPHVIVHALADVRMLAGADGDVETRVFELG
jgi:hypothetical protein